MSLPRVVLDTNSLISALLFRGVLSRLRVGWQCGRFIPLVCAETTAELARALAYPKFRLARAEIEAVILPCAEVVELPRPREEIIGLRDAKDAVFVHLARQGKADWLVSGDVHLQEMKGKIQGVSIATPAEFIRFIQLPGK